MHAPKLINIDQNAIADFDREAVFFDPATKSRISYWTDGTDVYWRTTKLKANPECFLVFNKLFAKDNKHCFMQDKRLKNVDVNSFEALNYCFAKDRHFVWCLGGEFQPYDIETFEVCDDGFNKNLMHQTFYFSDGSSADGTTQISSGYAKDKHQVYCYDHTGKVKILKGADPKTFVSCNNGKFAKDSRYIYYYFHQIKKADPKTWKLLDLKEGYSCDAKHAFRFKTCLENTDIATLSIYEFTDKEGYTTKFLKDKNGLFDLDGTRITEDKLKKDYA